MANDLAIALDPVLLMQRMGMEPDAGQAELLRSHARWVLLNIHRQAGKSTIAGVIAAHTAVYEHDSLILLLSRSLRQSTELFRKTLDAYHAIGGAAPADAETLLRLELSNGSRIISLPGNEETTRGYSGVRLLIVDEASRVPDQLYYSIRPMLAVSGGRLLALSTPFGKRGWFYEAWDGPEVWERYKVLATECPRITPEFLKEERRTLGIWFPQEYMCEFLQTTGAVFNYNDIEALLDPGLAPLFPIMQPFEGDEDEQ